jgi:cytochrome c oxidase subunit 4
MAHPTDSAAAERGESMVVILVVGVVLIALALGTFVVSGLHLGAWALPVALAFAVAKALLILLFFMELRHHRGGSRFAFAISVFFVLLLVGFVLGDVADRFRLTVPPGTHWAPEGPDSPANRFEKPSDTSGPQHTRTE